MSDMSRKEPVAIIGSGPAGLCAAYILRRAGHQVVVFEKAPHVALAGHSYRLTKNDSDSLQKAEHASMWKTTKVATDDPSSIVIDIPLRVFSGTYYTNWLRLLDHLGVSAKTHRFHYTFTNPQRQYAQYFSNFHRILPSLANGLFLNIYLLFWYLWFTAACFLAPPQTSNRNNDLIETFDEYHQRIGLPTKFVDWYILPLFSSVATCSHDDLRQIPADYVVRYRKGTFRFHHRTACMDTLERRLTEGVSVKLGQNVLSVETENDGRVRIEHCADGGEPTHSYFNHVILAISAYEASKIHRASAPVTTQLRTRKVSVKVHRPAHGTLTPPRKGFVDDNGPSERFQLHTQKTDDDDLISHSTHYHPSGLVVTVSPMIEDSTDQQHGVVPEQVDHTVHLMRPLVSPKSHALLQEVFGAGPQVPRSSKGLWRNGDGNVYIAGGFASAGLPLLENCLRSAIEAAARIGAAPPFAVERSTSF